MAFCTLCGWGAQGGSRVSTGRGRGGKAGGFDETYFLVANVALDRQRLSADFAAFLGGRVDCAWQLGVRLCRLGSNDLGEWGERREWEKGLDDSPHLVAPASLRRRDKKSGTNHVGAVLGGTFGNGQPNAAASTRDKLGKGGLQRPSSSWPREWG